MPTDVQRIQAVFLSAAEISDPADRAKYLDEACGGDAGLRARVEALLLSHDNPDSLLDHPAADPHDPNSAATHTVGHESGAGTDEEVTLGFLAPTARPDSLGRIGHYEVLQVLGQGGFGIVFRAFDEVLHRVVAVKVLSPQIAATSPARKRFVREARSSAQVRHENVVQVYEIGEQPLPYIAMEFIPGETLQDRLNRVGPVEPAEVVRVGRQIAEGLAAAHATDLIHRDIKPGNVLLEGGAERVKITDFGLARAADDASISQSGIIAGTPMYMAPEQAKGEKLDQRADLFSLGSVLYQMAAGRPPFRATGTLAVLKRVAEDKPRDIREITPETPQWLCDIIAKLHAKNPDERYQSAREVADVLADCEAQLKANSKLKDFSRIPRGKSASSGKWKWVAAAVLLLPVIALVVTEFAGVTHLFWGQQGASGGDPQAQAPPPAIAPFDAAQSRSHQEAWSKCLGVPVEFTNGIGMKFRIIPPGTFTMGSSKEEIDFWLKQDVSGFAKECLPAEGPPHEVEITHPFALGQTEITVGQFRQFVKATGYKTQAQREAGAHRHFPNGDWALIADMNWLDPGFPQTDDHPVVCVSWNDAVAFCDWLSRQEGKTYRLPTEAEWEYCCRAGSRSRWSFGEDEDGVGKCARVFGNSERHPWPVGGLTGNAWGLHDMHGNVWEWCQDVYEATYYKASPPKNPPGPGTDGARAVRGGSGGDEPVCSRSAFRGVRVASDRSNHIGFRVMLDVSPPASGRAVPVAKQELQPPTFTNGIGMDFVIVPKGKSWLGGGKDKPGDKEVEIPAEFYLGKYEVTQEEWEKVMGENPSYFSRTGGGMDAVKDIPDAVLKRFSVETVSWDQCQTFVAKLNEQEKGTGWVYRLPTEVEWEFACRGGPMADKANSAFDFYFTKPTNTLKPAQMNFNYQVNRPCRVGSYPPSGLGFYDLHGNVWEWCADKVPSNPNDPQQAPERWCRSGSFGGDGELERAGSHFSRPPSFRDFSIGLRLVRVPSGAP